MDVIRRANIIAVFIIKVLAMYSICCFNRRNPVHRQDESHPGDWDYPIDKARAGAPLCQFAVIGCYRKNPQHFLEFSHSLPTKPKSESVPSLSSPGPSSG